MSIKTILLNLGACMLTVNGMHLKVKAKCRVPHVIFLCHDFAFDRHDEAYCYGIGFPVVSGLIECSRDGMVRVSDDLCLFEDETDIYEENHANYIEVIRCSNKLETLWTDTRNGQKVSGEALTIAPGLLKQSYLEGCTLDAMRFEPAKHPYGFYKHIGFKATHQDDGTCFCDDCATKFDSENEEHKEQVVAMSWTGVNDKNGTITFVQDGKPKRSWTRQDVRVEALEQITHDEQVNDWVNRRFNTQGQNEVAQAYVVRRTRHGGRGEDNLCLVLQVTELPKAPENDSARAGS